MMSQEIWSGFVVRWTTGAKPAITGHNFEHGETGSRWLSCPERTTSVCLRLGVGNLVFVAVDADVPSAERHISQIAVMWPTGIGTLERHEMSTGRTHTLDRDCIHVLQVPDQFDEKEQQLFLLVVDQGTDRLLKSRALLQRGC